jgi:hypothetical protein
MTSLLFSEATTSGINPPMTSGGIVRGSSQRRQSSAPLRERLRSPGSELAGRIEESPPIQVDARHLTV